jgi:LuxR family maltose regulon positive regulatory protein
LLAHFSKQARTNDHVRARMIYKILETIAYHKNSDIEEQDKSLEAALDLYAQSRFIRSFLNEKEELTPILEQYLARQPDQDVDGSNAHNAQTILKQLRDRTTDEPDEPLLSHRENEVLQQLIKGHSNKIIARKIDVSESTVRFHLRNIFVKLKVSSRLQAVTVAKQLRLI